MKIRTKTPKNPTERLIYALSKPAFVREMSCTLVFKMTRTKQQLIDISHQIDVLKVDLMRSSEQLMAIDEMAEDANIRAIVSETPDQANSAHEMLLAKERLSSVIASMKMEIETLVDKRDVLLEKLFEETQENSDSDKSDKL